MSSGLSSNAALTFLVSSVCDRKVGRMGTRSPDFLRYGMHAKGYIIHLF